MSNNQEQPEPKIKKQIKITYTCDVDYDNLIDAMVCWDETKEGLIASIKKTGVKSHYIRDYEVEEVESPFGD